MSTNIFPTFRQSTTRINHGSTKTYEHSVIKKKRLYCNAKNRASESSWSKYKAFLSEYTVALRTAKDKYFAHDLPSLLKSNPRKFWQTITPNHSFDISLLDDRQQPLSDAECSSVFNTFFTSVFTSQDHSDIPVAPEHDYPFMAPIDISVDGIACLINELKKTSACGIDDINTKLLKNTVSISSVILYHIFKQSLSSGVLPTDWKIAKVIPIFKTGDKRKPENYRPISLTSVSCKLLEHIIASHIYTHLEKNNFFFQKQHGFRKGLSCDT